MAIISTDISKAKKFLEEGQLIGLPTETVYGLAGNVYDELAISNIFKIKKRPNFNPLIVHTNCITRLTEFVTDIPDKALLLAKHFWPGPLTLLLKKKISQMWLPQGCPM
jgi:L-threonylcarbamoyladenylate synthase